MAGNIGSFKELIENSKDTGLFVDKSLFIQSIINSKQDPLLITRPRRWGKTININMLFYFFVNSDQLIGMGKNAEFVEQCNNLFTDLNIFKSSINPKAELAKTYMRKYPTILVSFALSGSDTNVDDVTKPQWNNIRELIVGKIAELFSEFNYLAQNLKRQFDEKIKEDLHNRNEDLHNRNEDLHNRIETYKKQFNVEKVPEDIAVEMYKQTMQYQTTIPTMALSGFSEQEDLEKFYRLRRGEPKNVSELSGSINFLAKLLYGFHKLPVYILIDEYDSLINKYFNQQDILLQLTNTFSGIFSALAKPTGMINDHIQNIIFTGILRVAKANIFSGLNNLQECTVLDENFSEYYGFTQTELNKLLEHTGEIAKKDEVMRWYNGYKIGKETIYNPWSVMQFMITKKLLPHWAGTGNHDIIKNIVINNKGREINKLLRDLIKNSTMETITVYAKKQVSLEDLSVSDSIWSFLIHTGYLTVVSAVFDENSGTLKCETKIPNLEIKAIYNSIIHNWLKQSVEIQGIIVSLFEQNYDNIADNVQNLLEREYDSPIFAKKTDSMEEVYHSLLLAELNKSTSIAQYSLLPEESSGTGRADILFIDHKNNTIVPIELKRSSNLKLLEKTAKDAEHQALTKKYGCDAKYQTFNKLPAVGMSFYGKNMALAVENIVITRGLD